MRIRLTPQDTSFYDMFIEAADNLLEATEAFAELVPLGPQRHAIAARIRELEHAGDEITHSLIRRLNATFVPPLDRNDVYRLTGRLDDVLDFVEEAADLLVLYNVSDLPPDLVNLSELLTEAARLTADGMRRLPARRSLEEYWIAVGEVEKRADQAFRRFLSRLFASGADPLTVMKLKQVGEALEAAADAFEHVADTVETVAVKES